MKKPKKRKPVRVRCWAVVSARGQVETICKRRHYAYIYRRPVRREIVVRGYFVEDKR